MVLVYLLHLNLKKPKKKKNLFLDENIPYLEGVEEQKFKDREGSLVVCQRKIKEMMYERNEDQGKEDCALSVSGM